MTLSIRIKVVEFHSADVPIVSPLLSGLKIGIAKDAAFTFIYDANVRLLEAMGAELEYFSPLHDACLPAVDALWLPGGYPELHAQNLAENIKMLAQLKNSLSQDKPVS